MKKLIPFIAISTALLLVACNTTKTNVESAKTVEPINQSKNQRPAFDSAAESVASSGFNANTNVRQFIRYEAAKKQFTEAELQNFFNGVVYKGNIINIMYRPSTSRPWYEFRTGNSGATKFNGG